VKRYVLVHRRQGIFVGEMMGLGFWSKMDSIEQTSVQCFENIQGLISWIITWKQGNDPLDYDYAVVEVGQPHEATVRELKSSGLGHMIGDMEMNILKQNPPQGRC
jgi:hypothetical protein